MLVFIYFMEFGVLWIGLRKKTKIIYENGDSYYGDLCNGKREGYGEYVSLNQQTSYVGMWKDGFVCLTWFVRLF